MSKKYLEDEDEYEWDDEYDDEYDEYDDSFDDVDDEEDDYPRSKKGKASSGSSRTTAATAVKKSGSGTKSGKASSGSKKGSGRTGSAKSASGTSASSARKASGKASSSSKKKTSAKKKKRRGIMIAVCLAEVLLLAVVCVSLYVVGKLNQMQDSVDTKFGYDGDVEVNNLPSQVLETMKGYTTYAVLGLDERNQDNYDTGRSDVIVLVSVNNDTGEITMVSVYRDTYLQVSKDGTFGKINEAYFRGGENGAKQAVEALNTNLDLVIDHYVTVNWRAVAEVIDLLGGVEMEISEEVFYLEEPDWGGTWLNSYIEQTARQWDYPVTYPEGPGFQTLNGVQAVALCRIRQVGMDFARAENQRLVAAQVFEKAKALVKKGDVATLINIVETVSNHLRTDMTVSDISKLLPGITKYYMGESSGFPFEDMRVFAEIGKADCVVAKDLLANVAELHRILYKNDEYTPSQQVIDISQQISAASGVYAN